VLLLIQGKVKALTVKYILVINKYLFVLVITCHRMLRTYGNTNILHLITLPTTVSLESYFYNNYTRSAIVLNLHQNNNYLPEKV
jgi:hypothetical protein